MTNFILEIFKTIPETRRPQWESRSRVRELIRSTSSSRSVTSKRYHNGPRDEVARGRAPIAGFRCQRRREFETAPRSQASERETERADDAKPAETLSGDHLSRVHFRSRMFEELFSASWFDCSFDPKLLMSSQSSSRSTTKSRRGRVSHTTTREVALGGWWLVRLVSSVTLGWRGQGICPDESDDKGNITIYRDGGGSATTRSRIALVNNTRSFAWTREREREGGREREQAGRGGHEKTAADFSQALCAL